ncbi:MAG: hypothetical protein IVW55_16415 [Chloroflexi bacterium]|nr:hypothetical protein [Chloroflexota bacterium]
MYGGSAYRLQIGANPEEASMLFIPEWQRLGVAWGADATWATVADLEAGVEMYVNDGDAWEAAN